jgi:TRAP-type C4-dicarboxylate transport system substrate-binding protein
MNALIRSLASRATSGLLSVATMAALLSSPTVHAVDLKMATGYPDGNHLTLTVRDFIGEVEKRTGGAVKIELHNNQSIVKLPDMMRAVQSNQVALVDMRLGNYGNQDPVYILDAIPFVAGDYDSALKLWQSSKPYLVDRFARRGIKVLFAMWNPPQGFYTSKPVTVADDLAGAKMRIYSTETRRMGELLKTEPLIVQFGEVPQAFATGLINAMFTSPQTGIDTQAWDFVKHLTMVGALYTKQIVGINADAFAKLSKSEQDAMLAAAEAAEKIGFERMKKLTAEQLVLIRAKGITVSEASPQFLAQLKKIGAQMEAEWKEKASPEQRKVLDSYAAATSK